jgi:hypothetical protein
MTNSNFMHNQPTLAPSQHIPYQPPPPPISSELTLSCKPFLATNPKPRLFLKRTCLGQGPKSMKYLIWKSHNGQKTWNIIRTPLKNITVCPKPHTLLQWAMGVSTLNLPHSSTPPFSTIFTSHHHQQPKPPTKPFNHNNMSSRHVKSFSNVLLPCIVVTFATSHWLRSRLKAEAPSNTVARKKADYVHSQRAIEGGRKNPDQNTVTAQRRHTFWKIQTSLRQPNPPKKTPWITRACSGHVTSSFNIRIRQLPHKPFRLPTHSRLNHHHKTYIHFSRQRTTQLAHTKSPRNVQ